MDYQAGKLKIVSEIHRINCFRCIRIIVAYPFIVQIFLRTIRQKYTFNVYRSYLSVCRSNKIMTYLPLACCACLDTMLSLWMAFRVKLKHFILHFTWCSAQPTEPDPPTTGLCVIPLRLFFDRSILCIHVVTLHVR